MISIVLEYGPHREPESTDIHLKHPTLAETVNMTTGDLIDHSAEVHMCVRESFECDQVKVVLNHLGCRKLVHSSSHQSHLAVFMSDQQGGVQAVRCVLRSLTPPLQVQHLVLQQHHCHLVVASDHFGHLWSLAETQMSRVTDVIIDQQY